MIGVFPSGPQVLRRVGMSRKPLSSRKTRWAPSLWTFFYSRPFVTFPVGDGFVVSLPSAAFGHLATPFLSAQQLPYMTMVIVHPKFLLNDSPNALQRPQIVGIAVSQ